MFEELVVFDLSTVLAGPSVGTFFAELGAKVTKIEHPIHGDVTRTWRIPGEKQEVTSYFSSINFRKEYITKDLTLPSDYAWLLEKLPTVDVLIMNFKSSDYLKFNLTKEKLHAINPRLIIGSISGFGDNSDRVAYDLILQAESGIMAMNGEPESYPTKMPIALIDVLAAHQLKEALLLALLKREKTRLGSWVSVSLYDAAVSSLVNQASAFLMNAIIPSRMGSLHPNIAPYGEIFRTKDDKLVTFAVGSDRQFQTLCKVLGGDLISSNLCYSTNEDRVKNRIKLKGEIAPYVLMYEAKELSDLALEHLIPLGIIKSLDEVFETMEAKELIRLEKQGNTSTKRVTQLAFKWK
jgi:crotonobetainyl-CoA:carnitine CoA-transferase CaiB-like acyl-CoA transferase